MSKTGTKPKSGGSRQALRGALGLGVAAVVLLIAANIALNQGHQPQPSEHRPTVPASPSGTDDLRSLTVVMKPPPRSRSYLTIQLRPSVGTPADAWVKGSKGLEEFPYSPGTQIPIPHQYNRQNGELTFTYRYRSGRPGQIIVMVGVDQRPGTIDRVSCAFRLPDHPNKLANASTASTKTVLHALAACDHDVQQGPQYLTDGWPL